VLAGCLDIDSSYRDAGFIRFCDAFNIPLVTSSTFRDTSRGTVQEHGGVIRHGAKLLYAKSEAHRTEDYHLVRKAYGGAYIGMCSKHLGADIDYRPAHHGDCRHGARRRGKHHPPPRTHGRRCRVT
jgi:acetyl-CoA carboxylase carboxyltransferase component